MASEGAESGSISGDDTTIAGIVRGRAAAPDKIRAGSSLGRYLVIEELGRGGMGVVVRAYDPKLSREVALKLVRTDVMSSSMRARLIREARAMAQLSHANVVAVYDVELDLDDGGMMLVMELVAGPTLRAWLKGEDKPQAQVLQRFREAGLALQAAHVAGLLHRDFKPSNVVLDTDGHAKVTDFGLARLLDEQVDSDVAPRSSDADFATDASVDVTEVGAVVGTPAYMAPEQHAGDALDARSDQYSFCIALWEALTGERPYRANSAAGLLHAKTEGPPPWPRSARVARQVAEAVRRGLAPRPADRWPAMADLLDALAPADSRRSWVLPAAAGAVVVAAGVGLLGRGSEPVAPCQFDDDPLAPAWGPEREAAIASAIERVTPAFAGSTWARLRPAVSEYAETWRGIHADNCEATLVRSEQSHTMMDRRAACLHRARVELDAVTRVLAEADVATISHAHELIAGLPSLGRCSDPEGLQQEVAPPPEAMAEAVERARADLAEARAFARAAPHRAAAILDELEDGIGTLEYRPVHVEAAYIRGRVLDELGQDEASAQKLREAMRAAIELGHWEIANDAATRLVVTTGQNLERHEEGLAYAEVAHGLIARAEATALAEARLRANVSSLLQAKGDLDEAQTEARAAIALLEGSDDPLARAHARASLASALGAKAKYEEALPEFRAVVALTEEGLDPEHPSVAAARGNLGGILVLSGDFEESEKELHRALEIRLAAFGPKHVSVADTRANLAALFLSVGRYEEAEKELRDVIALRTELIGENRVEVARARTNLASLLHITGRSAEAEPEHAAAAAVYMEVLGPDHTDVALALSNHANVLQVLDRLDEAEAEQRRALEIRLAALGPGHPDTAMSHHNLGLLLTRRERWEEAAASLRRGAEVFERALGPEHRYTAEANGVLGSVLRETGKLDEAIVCAEKAYAALTREGVPVELSGHAAMELARTLWDADRDRERARALAQEALAAYERAGPTGEPHRVTTEAWLQTHR